MRSLRASLGVALVALLAPVAVQAASAESPVIRFNTADQAAAKAAVLKRSDFGAGWEGGAQKPDLSDDTKCAGYDPKQADLVLTGAAESEFSFEGVFVTSVAHVLKTARMVQLDWQRTAVHSALPRCLREIAADESGVKVVSIKRMPFPKLTAYTMRMRMIADFTGPKGSVRMLFDFVFIGRGRTELSLMLAAPHASRSAVDAAEVRLARLMVSRTPA